MNRQPESGAPTLRVVLVDDHDLIRQGLRRSFDLDSAFEVVGEAGGVVAALALVDALEPDVIVLDIRLPDGSGLQAASSLRERHPSLGIVVLTMYAGDEHLIGALESGASAFVTKDAPAADVLAAARHAAAAPTSFAAGDLAGALRRSRNAEKVRLTEREGQVLQLLAEGLNVAALARSLYISESTVKSHIAKIYDKLGAANRAQALMTALRLNLLNSQGFEK